MLRILFLFLIVMNSVTFAQTRGNKEQKDTTKAYIFAEFEIANDVEVKKIFDEFDTLLIKDFKENIGSQAYIINYGTNREVAKREKQIRESINFRRHDTYRLTFVRGKEGGKLKTVFWIVPEGAELPDTISCLKNATC